jgi:hypothetical protein
VVVQSGIVAADRNRWVGTVVEVDSLPAKHNGIYTVLDTVRPFRPSIDVVELQRGAAVRADRFPTCCPRLEPARDDADVLRSDVQAPGASAAPVASPPQAAQSPS